MPWLQENWFWLLVMLVFVWVHLRHGHGGHGAHGKAEGAGSSPPRGTGNNQDGHRGHKNGGPNAQH